MNPDDTVASSAALDETELASSSAAQTAWSEESAESDSSGAPTRPIIAWRLVTAAATTLLLVCLLIAAVIVLLGDPTDHRETATPPTSLQTTMIAAPPVTITDIETPVTIVEQLPPEATVEEPPPDSIIGNGWTPQQLATSTCDVLWNSGTLHDAAVFVEKNSGWTYAVSRRWAERAAKSNCPAALRKPRP